MNKGVIADKYSHMVYLASVILEIYQIARLQFIDSYFVADSGHLS